MAKKITEPISFKDVAKEITTNYGMSEGFAMNMQMLFNRCMENEVKTHCYKTKHEQSEQMNNLLNFIGKHDLKDKQNSEIISLFLAKQ